MFEKKESYNIAIIGATGIVGESLLDILHTRKFPVKKIDPIASSKSAGNKVRFGDELLEVLDIEKYDFSRTNIAFFSAGSDVSKKFVPIATQSGAIVIDNTSAFRYEDNVPLIIPEVNPSDIGQFSKTNIISNPNCSTIQMLVALKPIHDRFNIKKINVSTYQAVSGSGKKGVNELLEQAHLYLNQQKITPSVYPKQIAFNVLPFVDSFCDNGYTKEEMKMVWETQKILDKNISVDATAVRVPVLIGHSESIAVETSKPIDIDMVLNDYENDNSIKVIDNPDSHGYPTAFMDGHGTDKVFVGRIRKSINSDNILNIWVVADNVRKGAALNSIQIAEKLIEVS